MEQFVSAFFQLFELTHLLFLFGGTLLGLVVGILPGLGGTSGLALVLPFVYSLEPSYALAMMIGVLAPTTTSDTFPAVLMGIPGTAGSQATVMDGFPLSKKGMAARALSAAFCSSLMGGVFGALILSISIYYAIPIIMAFGFGEQFLLIILALLMVGALTGENFIKGVTACILGLIIGSIGSAPITGDLRFTFGTLYLVEGVPIVIVGLGLFALPEIVGLLDSKGAIAKALKNEEGWFRGIKDVFKNWFLVLRCSSIGCIVGALPGLGGTVVDWIAYSHLKQTSKDTSNIGKGDIRGVIAPESANNAKEGGALIPTLLFGIPGSGNKVLLLGGFILIGIEPGLEMVTTHLDLTYLMIWSLAIANILGAGLCIGFASHISKLTLVRYYILAPVMIVLIFFATFNINRDWYDFIGLLGFGLIGITFKAFGWSRPALLIGFFLSTKVELLSYQTQAVYGLTFLTRPVSIILIVLCFGTILLLLRQKFKQSYTSSALKNKKNQIYYVLILLVLPLLMISLISSLDYRASLYPISLCVVSILLLTIIFFVKIIDYNNHHLLKYSFVKFVNMNIYEQNSGFNNQFFYYLSFIGYLIMNYIVGFPIASVIFINAFIIFHDKRDYKISIIISFVLLVILWFLSSMLTLQFPNGLIGLLIDMPWWLGGELN
ncbi:MAG: tripartite tricarboxylate transporter permease [Candidatus Puniceispirillales bacterium]|tara:strand:- start:45 stop:2030 length:1986 start_codon:yes stop_codon:yes gene_type:complete